MSTPTNEQREAEIKARLAAAMAAPWRECSHEGKGCVCGLVWSIPADTPVAKVLTHECEGMEGEGPRPETAAANAELIANAPADLSWLLSRIEELAKDAERYAKLKALYVGGDFKYERGDDTWAVMLFDLPAGCGLSANLDRTVDALPSQSAVENSVASSGANTP